MKKWLFNFTSEEEWKMCRQAIPVVGISSDLEVAMEMYYNQHIMDTAAQQKKKEQKEKPVQKATLSSKPTGITWGVEKLLNYISERRLWAKTGPMSHQRMMAWTSGNATKHPNARKIQGQAKSADPH